MPLPHLRCCVVSSCNNSSRDVPMHRFTCKEPYHTKWLEAVGREDLMTKEKKAICNGRSVCDIHFEDACKFLRNGRIILLPGSIPTLFMNSPPDGNLFLHNEMPFSDFYPKTNGNYMYSKELYNPIVTSTNIEESLMNLSESDDSKTDDPTIPGDRRCRLCLAENDDRIQLNHCTNIDGASRELVEILKKCCSIKISTSDDKPQTICINCLEKAKIAYEFSLCCEKADLTLQKEANNLKTVNNEKHFLIVKDFAKLNEWDNKVKLNAVPKQKAQLKFDPQKTYSKLSGIKFYKQIALRPIKHNLPKWKMHQNTRKIYVRIQKSAKQSCKDGVSETNPPIKSTICLECCRSYSKKVRCKMFTSVIIGKKRYICKNCGVRFAHRRNFKSHQLVHTAQFKDAISKPCKIKYKSSSDIKLTRLINGI